MQKTDFVTDQLLMSGIVERYSCWPTIQRQTVGTHCWQIHRIYCSLFGPPSYEVTHYVMHHDSAELIVGDPPFPVKRDNPAFKAAYDAVEAAANAKLDVRFSTIPEQEKKLVKICDLLEMTEFGMTEREMGNLLAVPIVLRTAKAALALAAEVDDDRATVQTVDDHLDDLWLRHEAVLRQGSVELGYNARGWRML